MKDLVDMIPTYQDMLDAHERIKPYINRTEVRTSDYLNDLVGAELFFKCENFQEPGAFCLTSALGGRIQGFEQRRISGSSKP